MTFSDQAMSETFYLSNMSPQAPAFNRGIWKNLETLVREWAEEDDSIFVVTGGILSETKGTIGPDRVTVPSKFYKVIYDITGDKKMIAFILPNEKGIKPLQDYVVTVHSVQKVTGIDFFHCLRMVLKIGLKTIQTLPNGISILLIHLHPGNQCYSMELPILQYCFWSEAMCSYYKV